MQDGQTDGPAGRVGTPTKVGAKDVRGCRRGGRDAWGRVRGMSGRGYGDYFSTILSVQK